MKRISAPFAFLLAAILLPVSACKDDFLNVAPTGQLSEEILSTGKGLETLLTGAYSMLGGRLDWYGGASNWLHGSIQGGDANVGSSAGDCCPIHLPIQRFQALSNNSAVHSKWRACFEGVSRANAVLGVLVLSRDASLSQADRDRIAGEARFLRGHYYFELKRLFNKVPYIDETMAFSTAQKVPNDADIWPAIEQDFQYAFDNLPELQTAAGRANKWAAGAYLAKTYLYQHKFNEARSLFEQVITQGRTASGHSYGLLDRYADVFNAEYDNSRESVFANQAAANTGSLANANYEFVLNFPYNTGPAGPGNCCGFYQPSFDLANSFRTDAAGLPMLKTYNDPAHTLKTDFGIPSGVDFVPDTGHLDPRIDHSIGRRGIPYLDWRDHPGADWIREQEYAGPYSPKKFVYYKTQEAVLTDGSGWTRGFSSMNYNIIRFADVLLMAAEAEVETGNPEKAREYVNRVRSRAANPDGFVRRTDGSPAAKYTISTYETPWTNAEQAREAVRFERKLELSGEGHRFFDLVRWGIASDAINRYLAYESAILPVALNGSSFVAGKHEHYPIPASEIDLLGSDVLKQNPGY